MTRKQKAKLGLILLPLTAIVCVLLTCSTLIWPAHKIYQSRNWPEISCTIEDYQIEEAGIHQSQFSPSVQYKKSILYSYRFNKQYYYSDRFSFFVELPNTYKSNPPKLPKSSTCFVNPQNPSEAVLSRNISFYTLLLSILPLGGLSACVYGTYRGLKTLTSKETHKKTPTEV
jgi:hypothetical protein